MARGGVIYKSGGVDYFLYKFVLHFLFFVAANECE